MRRSRAGASFRQAVLGIPELEHALHDGHKALAKNDRQRISCNDSRAIIGSINLEESLHFRHPNKPLWDYGIGLRVINSADHVKWIEVHPASSTHVDELLKKLQWLQNWLRNSAPKLNALPGEFVWIASGKVHLQKGSPQMKKLYQAGMRFAGERFVLNV